MEIEVMQEPIDGLLEVSVRFREVIDGFGHSAEVMVWVKESDSRQEIAARARVAAAAFLRQCLSAHDAEYPPESRA